MSTPESPETVDPILGICRCHNAVSLLPVSETQGVNALPVFTLRGMSGFHPPLLTPHWASSSEVSSSPYFPLGLPLHAPSAELGKLVLPSLSGNLLCGCKVSLTVVTAVVMAVLGDTLVGLSILQPSSSLCPWDSGLVPPVGGEETVFRSRHLTFSLFFLIFLYGTSPCPSLVSVKDLTLYTHSLLVVPL